MSDRVCRCAHPEVMADTSEHRWPAGVELTWWLDESTIPFGVAAKHIAVAACLNVGFGDHVDVCGIAIRRVYSAADARLLVSFQPIDGPYGVLAETQLPVGVNAQSQLWMHLDAAEDWTPELLTDVARHEFGHFLGQGHVQPPTLAVMNPTLNPGLPLQPADIEQDQLRYGPPAPVAIEQLDAPILTLNVTAPEAGTYAVRYDGADGAEFTLQFTVSGPGPSSVTFTPVSVQRIA